METLKQINAKSDFKLIEAAAQGEEYLFDAPFVFRYTAGCGSGKCYIAKHCNGEYVNCKPAGDGRLLVSFDNHGLGCGTLMCERTFYLTDADFADGICSLTDKRQTGVLLTAGETQFSGIEVQLPPYYQQGPQGEPMTWEKMTDDDKEQLVGLVVQAMGGKVYHYKTDTFTRSEPVWLAKGLRYAFFREIQGDTACYLLTSERCMKFDMDTLEVAWDVELPGGSNAWHNANLMGRVIGDTVYIAKAKYAIDGTGFVMVKLNDADGSFISSEDIPIPLRPGYQNFYGHSNVLVTEQGYITTDYNTRKIMFCDAATLEVSEIAQMGDMTTNTPSYLRWITKPDGTVVLAYLQLDRDHVLHIATEEREYYSIEFTGNVSGVEYFSIYIVDLKALYARYSQSGYRSANLTDLGGGKYTTPGSATKYPTTLRDKEVYLNTKFNPTQNLASEGILETTIDRRFYGVTPVFFPSYKNDSLYVATDYVSGSVVGNVSHLQIFYI